MSKHGLTSNETRRTEMKKWGDGVILTGRTANEWLTADNTTEVRQ